MQVHCWNVLQIAKGAHKNLEKPIWSQILSLSTIKPINHWAYRPSSLSTIKPIDHQAYQPSSQLTIKPINLWSSFATFKPFGLFLCHTSTLLNYPKQRNVFSLLNKNHCHENISSRKHYYTGRVGTCKASVALQHYGLDTHTHGDEDDPSSEDELRTGTGYCSNRERLRDNTSADVLQWIKRCQCCVNCNSFLEMMLSLINLSTKIFSIFHEYLHLQLAIVHLLLLLFCYVL